MFDGPNIVKQQRYEALKRYTLSAQPLLVQHKANLHSQMLKKDSSNKVGDSQEKKDENKRFLVHSQKSGNPDKLPRIKIEILTYQNWEVVKN